MKFLIFIAKPFFISDLKIPKIPYFYDAKVMFLLLKDFSFSEILLRSGKLSL